MELDLNINTLTPVEMHGGIYFKREDKFAPLGYGHVNGSKLRQLIWLTGREKAKGKTKVVSGAVGGSPQHIFVAQVAQWNDMECLIYTGVQDIESNYLLVGAERLGAKIESLNITYPVMLDKKSKEMAEAHSEYFHLETNITLCEKYNIAEDIGAFHEVGGLQVKNVPKEVTRLVVPAGSCNSMTSVLYGLYLHGYKNIKEIVMCGIGNYGSKNPNYVPKRLHHIDPKAVELFNFPFYGDNPDAPIKITWMDVYDIDGYQYSDLQHYTYAGIQFHPRYEGKIMSFLHGNGYLYEWDKGDTMFWIVGSEPTKI